MRDFGIDRRLVQEFDDSDRRQRGWNVGKWGFRKMFRDYFDKLNVTFFDECCPAATPTGIFPVRFNDTLDRLEFFNGTAWTAMDAGSLSGTMIGAVYPQAAQDDIVAGAGGAIAVTNYLTTINTDAGGDAFTLADGTVVGQMKKILLVVDGGGDGVVTPANLSGGTTLTFNDAADYAILQWDGTDWVSLELSGVALA